MSTLTSAQLCVKRSSTRLHAPPGGHSSLSFGPGGFGTTDTAASPSTDKTDVDPAAPSTAPMPPNSRGGYSYGTGATINNNNNYYAPPPSFSRGNVSSADPRGFYAPPSSAGSAASREQLASSATSRWSAQPPLTASKRDQNWEKKRRLWLARKNAAGGGYAAYDAPPLSAPSQGAGWPSAGDDPMGAAMPPASPLSKFMHQHAGRLPTAVPTGPAGYYYDADQSRAEGYYPPPTALGGPPPTAGSYSRAAPPPSTPYLNYGNSQTLYPPPSRGTTAASSTATTTRAGSRQPPGGHSNWSPFN